MHSQPGQREWGEGPIDVKHKEVASLAGKEKRRRRRREKELAQPAKKRDRARETGMGWN